jgi:hypothetical protein
MLNLFYESKAFSSDSIGFSKGVAVSAVTIAPLTGKNMKNALLCLLFVFLGVFVSCDNNKYKQTYSEFPVVKEIKASRIINLDSLYIKVPLIKVKDSMCCICDMLAQDGFFFNLYTFPDFKHIKSFGRKGQGPNELTSIAGIDICDGKLYALAPNLHKVYIYDISSNDLEIIPKEILNIPDTLTTVDLAIEKEDKLFFSCLNQSYIAAKLDIHNNMSAEKYFNIPLQKHGGNLTWLSKIGYNAKKNVLVSVTTFREILFIRNMNDKYAKEIIAVGSLGTPEKSQIKEYEIPNNTCFMQLFCGDEYIYTTFSGANINDILINNNVSNTPQIKINVYSYDGKPIIQYVSEIKDNSICICYVDEYSKKLFAFSNETDPASIGVFEIE